MFKYSLLVTSCGRHDLLAQTLNSFIEQADVLPQETIIVEDGPTPAPHWINAGHMENLGVIKWINKAERKGQLNSADRLWAECSNEIAFWSEDDWCYTQSGFMQKSYDILSKYPEVFTVSLRGSALTNWQPLVNDPRFPIG